MVKLVAEMTREELLKELRNGFNEDISCEAGVDLLMGYVTKLPDDELTLLANRCAYALGWKVDMITGLRADEETEDSFYEYRIVKEEPLAKKPTKPVKKEKK